MFRDLERVQTVFTSIAAHRLFGANLSYRGQTMNGEGMLVSGSYFPVLGIQPALGRLLEPAGRSEGRRVARRRARATAIGRRGSIGTPRSSGETLIVNGQHLTIVGVAPAGFEGTTLGRQAARLRADHACAASWSPASTSSTIGAATGPTCSRRLRPGISIEEAPYADQRAVPRDRERRRSAAAEGHERPDAGALQDEAARAWRTDRAGRARSMEKRERRCGC